MIENKTPGDARWSSEDAWQRYCELCESGDEDELELFIDEYQVDTIESLRMEADEEYRGLISEIEPEQDA